MAKFDTEIIQIEGGYSNDPDDPGGETKYGISKRSYPNVDIKNLTVQQAIDIYTRDFWNRNNIGSFQNQTLANIVFRFIVHSGQDTAVRILQTLVRVPVDGEIGSVTLRAVNASDPGTLQNSFRLTTCRYYLDLVTRKPTQEKYFKGWIKRALM